MTQINVKYVNPANDGKKFGSIKDVNGVSYMVPKDMVHLFRTGMQDVQLENQTWGTSTMQVVTQPPGRPTADSVALQMQGNQITAQPRVVGGTMIPSAYQAGNAVPRPVTGGNSQDRMIFCTGIVGRAMGSGQFQPAHVRELLQSAADAYDEIIQGDNP